MQPILDVDDALMVFACAWRLYVGQPLLYIGLTMLERLIQALTG